MQIPNTYLDKINSRNSNYIFISYCHDDKEQVYSILNDLLENPISINIWYDKELKLGDIWKERAKEQIENQNCKGAIIFFSEKTLLSHAIYYEMELIAEKLRKIKEDDIKTHFKVIPFFLSDKKPVDYSKELTPKLDDNNYFSVTTNYATIVSSGNRLYCNINEYNLKKNQIIDVFEMYGAADRIIFKNDTVVIKDFEYKKNNEEYYGIGKYPIEPDKDQADIVWKLLYHDSKYIYLVNKYIIDFVDDGVLNVKISDITKHIRQCTGCDVSCELITENMLSYVKNLGPCYPTDYADNRRNQNIRLYWIKDDNKLGNFKLCNSRNEIIEFPENDIDFINAGLRMVLKVPKNNDK